MFHEGKLVEFGTPTDLLKVPKLDVIALAAIAMAILMQDGTYLSELVKPQAAHAGGGGGGSAMHEQRFGDTPP